MPKYAPLSNEPYSILLQEFGGEYRTYFSIIEAIARDALESLIEKSELVSGKIPEKRKYLIVSKSGFTTKCRERMKKEGVIYWGLEDLKRRILGEN